jgi:SAM-dependent methyltransferase
LKIFLYLYYFFRSVFLRGLFNTIRLLRAEVTCEKQFGIKTSMIKKSDSAEFFHYQGAGYLTLLRVFKEIVEETKDFNFVDIGCGKGRAVYVAEYCGYTNLTGIELDKELVEEAKENLKLYPFKRKESAIVFVHENALDYAYKNKPAVYFLFNPFNEAILRKVLETIIQSTQSETWFVYMNPLFPKPFAEHKIPIIKEYKTGRYKEVIVFALNKR